MSRSSFSPVEKLTIINLIRNEHYPINEVASKYNVCWATIRSWIHKFETLGEAGLEEAKSNTSYSKEFKLNAVKAYLSGRYSMREVARKYGVSSYSSLRNWVNDYNGHRVWKSKGERRQNSMTKGRKTNWEERIEIVQNCIKNGKDYQSAAEDYSVSYQQVYQWVKKYESGGDEALQDQRGKKKSKTELTPEEKFKLEKKQLERENERLRAEKLILKKVRADRKGAKLNQIRFQDKYVAIQELHEQENMSIQLLCDTAGISRAAYYKWKDRVPTPRELQNEEILKEMKNLQEKVDGIFGYRQMTLQMNRKFEETLNHKRIYRLMKLFKMRSVTRVKKKVYKRSSPDHVAENVLNREFEAEQPNEKWVTDVTEFKYGHSKKAYLSAIRDLYDGSIISYVFGHSNNNDLVFETLDNAITSLNDESPLIHSDRGFQYTSHGFKRKIDQAGIYQSMSRVGRCIDNGPMESFWGTLKCEKYYLHKYDTYEELSSAIEEYIYFYNHERYQEKLNGLSPMEYRAKAA
ncbi:IS3 family transposase [Pontibacillus sp. ALD_SL1]|nr:IS3 family transposase [Pontibacillus sp. ALD_SL1]QSS99733.1 IS3 family transposase [Pontibacillus sp. ALD_SL1]QST00126.1 IS3 family transposase [Pontibacillus sp. ALD_SL1]